LHTGSHGGEIEIGKALSAEIGSSAGVEGVGNGDCGFVVATGGAATSEKARRGVRQMCYVRGAPGRLI
jgi:hypothetical protein